MPEKCRWIRICHYLVTVNPYNLEDSAKISDAGSIGNI